MASWMLAIIVSCVVASDIDNDLPRRSSEREVRVVHYHAFGDNPIRFVHGRRFLTFKDVARGALVYQRLGEDVEVFLRFDPLKNDRKCIETQKRMIEKIIEREVGPRPGIRVLMETKN